MKLKAVLITAALAIGSIGTASAQINVTINDGISGGLFLTVYDPTRAETYNVDLQTNVVDYLASPTGFGPDAGLASWIAGAPDQSSLIFDVGADNFEQAQWASGTFGVLVTANSLPNNPGSFSFFNSLSTNVRNYSSGVNGAIANNGGIDTSGAGHWTDPFTWGGNVGQAIGGTTTGSALGTPIALWGILGDATAVAGSAFVVVQVAELALQADGSLVLSGTPPVVPIPAAGWLLTSAFAGLITVARRRVAA